MKLIYLWLLSFFLVLFVFAACSKQKATLQEIVVADAFLNQQEIKLSRFVQEVRYLPLETQPSSLISDYPIIKVEDYIIVRNTGKPTPLMLFDKLNGKFIRCIGNIGRGPNEYSVPVFDFYNYFDKNVYTMDITHREIKILDVNGEYKNSFKTPDVLEPSVKGGKLGISFSTYLDNETYVSFVNNFTGAIKNKLVIFNRDSILKIYPNYLRWGNKDITKNHRPSFSPLFFRWSNNLYFKEMFNDTLFQVKVDTLVPRFVFRFGEHGLSYEKQELISPSFAQISNEYFLINRIMENSEYIFFNLTYDKKEFTCFFDKNMKTTHVCKLHEGSQSGFIDDINDFMPFVPRSITSQNELIAILSPLDIMQWIRNNPEKSKATKEKLSWLNTYSETSNPVVVIAKFTTDPREHGKETRRNN